MNFHRRGASANYGTDTFSDKNTSFNVVEGRGDSARISIAFTGSLDRRSNHSYRLELDKKEIQDLIRALANSKSKKVRDAVAETLSESVRDLSRLVAIASGIEVSE